jgi:hypothetical protein
MSTWKVTTEADTSSKARRVRNWTIKAATLEDASYEARMRHLAIVGWNAAIWCDVEEA